MTFSTVILQAAHHRKDFSCGKQLLDTYLHSQASQDMKRKLSACFVCLDAHGFVTGYYTLSNDSIAQQLLPPEIKKKMPPSYHHLPATLLGRLAVDKNHRGKGLGELLLIDALKRAHAASEYIGSMAVIVDPLDDDAHRFYEKYGFIQLPDSGKMFLPMKTVAALFC